MRNLKRLTIGIASAMLAGISCSSKQVATNPQTSNMTLAQQRALPHLVIADNNRSLSPDRRVNEYRNSLAYDPSNRHALFGLAQALFLSNRVTDAKTIWNDLSREGDVYGKLSAKWLARIAAARNGGAEGEKAKKWIERWRKVELAQAVKFEAR